MMKKYGLIILTMGSLLLGGCTSQSEKASTSNSAKIEVKKQQSSKKESFLHSDSTDSKQLGRINTFNQKLRRRLGSEALLPAADGLTKQSNKLNIRYNGTDTEHSIFYSVGKKAKGFNDNSLAQETPYAEFSQKNYATTEAAAQQIDHRTAADFNGLPPVDLGHNIQGYLDAGAGQRYLSWNEGNWSLVIHAPAAQEQQLKNLAKQTVNLLEKYALPVPRLYGQVYFEVENQAGQRDQVITWQDEKTVYKLSAHNFTTAIKMVASMKEK
ncbi:hypothetical protein [Liquorilactobacillus capillatus]|uniref:Lipoprotein n=1 Tax=Liquorilactobacillus capillatus DSM 19910 TaxID=1423731 RepID=A0A0R1MFP8_9LACO|nr:hypothetical protein [Liquorilactobacillus capillatus]KRL02456.1 lipoprotein [Liquorilactobacillus capillatus DSM 19910]